MNMPYVREPTVPEYLRKVEQRLCRIETRLTKQMVAQGIDTGARMPLWFDDGVIEIPHRSTSFSDILSVVPEDWDRDYEITVLFQGHVMGAVLRP
jgi:hypothetical protein